MNKIVKAVISVLASGLFLSAATFCWFINENEINFPASFGSTKTAYFAGGDGTEENPYQINSPVHLYNLAWLQYFGYFNLNPEQNNGAAQSHFVLTDNVDMSGFGSAIPPIGTAQFPFIGSFNGNDKTISGVTVSDKRGTAADTLKTRPVNAAFNANDALLFTDVSETVCITGLFGVTGNYGGYTDGYAAEHPEFTQENAEKMTVKNFYADKLHIKSNAAQTLAGLAAGYVGSNFLNVGVYRGDISFASGATGISALSGSDTVVSKYSLVGAYDENLVEWSAAPTGGAGAGFGGSIDMKTLSRRVGYMITSMLSDAGTVPSAYNYSVSNSNTDFHLNLFKGGIVTSTAKSEFYWKTSNLSATQYVYGNFLKNTYLPLNVSLSSMGLDKDDENQVTLGSYTYHSNGEYMSALSESVDDNNTGYIVGGAKNDTTTTSYVTLRIQPLSAGSGQTIYKSLGYTYSSNSYSGSGTVTYTGTNLDLVTNIGGTFYRIVDDYNKDSTGSVIAYSTVDVSNGSTTKPANHFVRYNDVRNQLHELLQNDLIYGMRFVINDSSSRTFGNGVSINGKEYSTYEFVSSSINFNLKEPGYMTAVFGGYYSNRYNDQFSFSINEVGRNESGSGNNLTSTIIGVQEITNVWINESGNARYNLSSSDDTTGYTLIYDKDWYNNNGSGYGNVETGTAYYVEIPLPAGDYCLSGVGQNEYDSSAYLMYLDIGANGASGGQTKKPYSMQSVDFVNSAAVVTDAAGEYPDFNDVTFSVAGVGSGSPYTVFERKTTAESDGTTKVSFNYFNITDVIPAPENYGEYNSALAPAYD